MAQRIRVKYLGNTENGLTQGTIYECIGSVPEGFHGLNDVAAFFSPGASSGPTWEIQTWVVDGDIVYDRDNNLLMKERADDGGTSNSAEGRDAAKDKEASGRGPGASKENREGRTDERKRG